MLSHGLQPWGCILHLRNTVPVHDHKSTFLKIEVTNTHSFSHRITWNYRISNKHWPSHHAWHWQWKVWLVGMQIPLLWQGSPSQGEMRYWQRRPLYPWLHTHTYPSGLPIWQRPHTHGDASHHVTWKSHTHDIRYETWCGIYVPPVQYLLATVHHSVLPYTISCVW